MATLSDDDMEQIKGRFKQYDTDGSGSISQNECKQILGKYMGDDELKKFFDSIDLNNDGRVTFEEFEKSNS